ADLRLEVRTAALDLERQRIAVPGRATLHDVGDIDRVAVEADPLDEAGEETTGTPDERDPVAVLLLTWAFAHEHEVGFRVAGAEHHLRGPFGERAKGAGERDAFKLGERCVGRGRRRWFEQRHGRPITLPR